jgi:hypothetical protein
MNNLAFVDLHDCRETFASAWDRGCWPEPFPQCRARIESHEEIRVLKTRGYEADCTTGDSFRVGAIVSPTNIPCAGGFHESSWLSSNTSYTKPLQFTRKMGLWALVCEGPADT